MKKSIITSLVAMAAIFALPAAAQTDNNATANENAETCSAAKECCRQQKPGHERKANLFEGIELTDAQKESLKTLMPQRKDRAERRDSLKARQQRRMQPDSLAPRVNPGQKRAEFVKGVKEILTPDQYVVFLENIVINNAQLPGQNAHRKDFRNGQQRMKDHGKAHDMKAKHEKGKKDMRDKNAKKRAKKDAKETNETK